MPIQSFFPFLLKRHLDLIYVFIVLPKKQWNENSKINFACNNWLFSGDIWWINVCNECTVSVWAAHLASGYSEHQPIPASQQPWSPGHVQWHLRECDRVRPGCQPATHRIPKYCCKYPIMQCKSCIAAIFRMVWMLTEIRWCHQWIYQVLMYVYYHHSTGGVTYSFYNGNRCCYLWIFLVNCNPL